MTAVATTPPTAKPPTGTPDVNGLLAGALQNMMTLAETAGAGAQQAITNSAVALAQAATAMLEEAKKQSTEIGKGAAREIKDHPLTTAAAVTVAAVAVISLMAAYQHTSGHVPGRDDASDHDAEEVKKKHKKGKHD